MKHLLFGLKYVLTNRLFSARRPLICGLVMHNKCNLRCLHCRITDRQEEKISYTDSVRILDSFYNEGGRTVYFEGGEPFLWRDGEQSLEDVVNYAHRKGYLSTVIYTNGTFPLETSADTVFISLDGLKETNNSLRGDVFDRIMENILKSSHPSMYINYTINNYNKDEIVDFCDFVSGIKQVKGIFFYFHTPYYGYDDLFVSEADRIKILNKIIENKKRYRILNSVAGLRSALKNDWERPLNICRIYEGEKIFSCCRFSGNDLLCRDCGYLSYAEIHQVLKFRPSSIINALKYF